MARLHSLVVLVTLIVYSLCLSFKKLSSPPHCTQVTKDTDYVSRFTFTYPVSYLVPGQREAHQKLFCINPPAVNKAVSVVCDWAAPPLVSLALADEYVAIVRVDPSGRFLGNAVVTTYQLCSHNNISTTSHVAVTQL